MANNALVRHHEQTVTFIYVLVCGTYGYHSVLRLKMAPQNFLQTQHTNPHVNPFGGLGAETCAWPL